MNKKSTKMRIWWDHYTSKRWVRFLINTIEILAPFIIYFGIKAIPIISVNRHPVKVKAVIVDHCHTGGGKSPSKRGYYYEYYYNDTLYVGMDETNGNIIYGEIGDTITIRCNKNKPSQSIYNINDYPNYLRYRALDWKENTEYKKNEPECNTQSIIHWIFSVE